MFVTTSRHKLSDAERADQPDAGAVLVVDAGVRGHPGGVLSAAAADAIAALPVNADPDDGPIVRSA
jgi:hypothetical protein